MKVSLSHEEIEKIQKNKIGRQPMDYKRKSRHKTFNGLIFIMIGNLIDTN